MTLCSTADVERVAQTTFTSSVINPVIEEAEEWIKHTYGGRWDTNGEIVEKFFNVNQDEILKLGIPDPAITSVKAFFDNEDEDESGLDLTEAYDLLSDGRVQLRFLTDSEIYHAGTYSDGRPLPGTTYRRLIGQYRRVEITYSHDATVPSTVREACAMIVAATLLQRDADVKGIRNESISSYSYSRADNADIVIPTRARSRLRSAIRKKRAFVF